MSTASSATAGARRCVDHLLAGERNPDVLRRLFIYLRTRSYGHITVEELGHFVAHYDERDRGITWKRAVDFFTHMEFQALRLFDPWKSTIPPNKELMDRALRAGLRLTGPVSIREQTGLGFNAAKRLLETALPKIVIYKGDTLAVVKDNVLTDSETKVIKAIAGNIISRPIFNASMVMEDLIKATIKNHILLSTEIYALRSQQEFVSAFVVTLMHNAAIPYESGRYGYLHGGTYSNGQQRRVKMACDFTISQGQRLTLGGAIYEPELDADEWCEPELLGPVNQRGSTWEGAIELSPEGRLRADGPLTVLDVAVPDRPA